MVRTVKSWFFWLGAFISAIATVYILTGTYYTWSWPVGIVKYINTSRAVTGFAFFLAGLYLMYSGKNKPDSTAEIALL
jgi:hypothetical protein